MARVVGRELADDGKREVEEPALLEGEVDREPRLPRLRPALGIVEQLRLGSEMVEIVPLGLEQTDRIQILELKVDPVEIIDLWSHKALRSSSKRQCLSLLLSSSMTEVASGSVIF